MNKKKWSKEEEEVLISIYKDMSIKNVAIKLDRSYHSTKRKIDELRKEGKIGFSRCRWTESEVDFLKENRMKLSAKNIAEKIGRSEDAVRIKASSLGLTNKYDFIAKTIWGRKGKTPKVWTEVELEYLKKSYGNISIEDICLKLDRKKQDIYTKVSSMKGEIKLKIWSDEQDEYLRSNYSKKTTRFLSNHLNKSSGSIYDRARKLGLKKKKNWWLAWFKYGEMQVSRIR